MSEPLRGEVIVLDRGPVVPSGLTGRGRWRRVGDTYDVIPAEPYEEPGAVPPANLARRIALRDAMAGKPIPLPDTNASTAYYEGAEHCELSEVIAARYELGFAVLCLAGMTERHAARARPRSFAEWTLTHHRHVEDGVVVWQGSPPDCPLCVYPIQLSRP